MKLILNLNRLEDYQTFLAVKRLPIYRIAGRVVEFPDEYADRLGLAATRASDLAVYSPIPGLFDYQRDIARLAIRKRKFAVFAEPGLGKTLIMLEWCRHALTALPVDRCVLIVSPLMVVRQTIAECRRFYGDSLAVEQVAARDLQGWLREPTCRIGITNYEALKEGLERGQLGALAGDETSIMKNHYGAYGRRMIDLGKGLDWKLCLTGTPAPNDPIEYGNHAVFLDAFPTVNSFLAKFFVNRGQTNERWDLKPHALEPFYRALSHWCIFLSNPAVYGWKDNVGTIPPVRVHVHDVALTPDQWQAVVRHGGDMYGTPGGITSRSKLSQIAKGRCDGKDVDTLKPAFIKALVGGWSDEESTIIWCRFNAEQEGLADLFPGCADISGATPYPDRERLVADFQEGRRLVMISKPDVLGFGLNLQIATRHVFSSCEDSYESYWQAVKRSNRVGSTKPLDVHLPVTDVERPMMENVLRKAKRVQRDTEYQERLFKEQGYVSF